ncbi:VOC family protein [Actinomadura harenae]|uniref:Glyoxalase n=1 Tax=Actinomadura harenae TaxID=2483351 RepID=A0A3M2M3M0_9ACTN|nr:VOC family protein [Actinomadura harenae]RMI44199.1 glyoxalase [Actinomadura harenae]
MSGITGIWAAGVPVSDQDKAVDFYVGVLGMEVRRDVPLGRFGGRWIEVAPAGAATTIALVPASEQSPAGRRTEIRLATADARALRDELVGRGVDADDVLVWEGAPPMFAFRDQDGNGLSVTQV